MTINLDLLTEYEVSLAKPHYGRCKLFGTDELKTAGCTCASEERNYLIKALVTARTENKMLGEQVERAKKLDEAITAYLDDFVIEEMDDAEAERIAFLNALSNFRSLLQKKEKETTH